MAGASAEPTYLSEGDRPNWGVWVYAVMALGLIAGGLTLLGPDPEPKVARGLRGAVASASPESSDAGLAMLAAGGNAADALVATSFAVSVTRPQSTGIGGGGFILYHDAESGKTYAIDCREEAPSGASRDMYLDAKKQPVPGASTYGALASGVPGLVKGLCEFHARFGKLPFKQVIAPAIKLARDGFPVDAGLAGSAAYHRKKLAKFPESAEVFLPGGEPVKRGELLRQPDLAKTLTAIAKHGADGFYKGRVAELIVASQAKHGGLISMKDLASYKVRWRTPITGHYQGHRIVTMPPPSSGMHLIQILNQVERFGLGQYEHNGPEHVHLLAEAMMRAYADRSVHSGDPDFWQVPTDFLTSRDYAAKLSASIRLDKATPEESVTAGKPPKTDGGNTTHISIIDAAGNAASSTQTINTGLGSKLIAAGTGILMNNEMDDFSKKPGVPNAYGLIGGAANAIEGGKRPMSSMSPTIIFDSRGRLELVVGTPGGARIITSVLQPIINHIDFGLSPKDCVWKARVHHQWTPKAIRIENFGRRERRRGKDRYTKVSKTGIVEITPATIQRLRELGHDVYDASMMCNVQAVFRNPDTGELTAVSDRRATGEPRAR